MHNSLTNYYTAPTCFDANLNLRFQNICEIILSTTALTYYVT